MITAALFAVHQRGHFWDDAKTKYHRERMGFLDPLAFENIYEKESFRPGAHPAKFLHGKEVMFIPFINRIRMDNSVGTGNWTEKYGGSNHWGLAVVVNVPCADKAWIYLFDSGKGKGFALDEKICKKAVKEVLKKTNAFGHEKTSRVENAEFIHVDYAWLQEDGVSCGIFALSFMLQVTKVYNSIIAKHQEDESKAVTLSNRDLFIGFQDVKNEMNIKVQC